MALKGLYLALKGLQTEQERTFAYGAEGLVYGVKGLHMALKGLQIEQKRSLHIGN